MPSPMCDAMHQTVLSIQKNITQALEAQDSQSFITDKWTRPGGGGGQSMVLENGTTFEKAGVNVSAVFGKITKESAPIFAQFLKKAANIDANPENAEFYATGVSLVIHPQNPFIPTTHANYRYFEIDLNGETLSFFGGGADLTPYYLFEEDAKRFHSVHKTTLDKIDPAYYPKFKTQCDNYFYLSHRKEARGIGGIFYDYLNDKDPEILRKMAEDLGQSFIDAYCPIVEKRKNQAFTDRNKDWQLFRRGRYVEFNLIHDRGTAFGLKTNGRIESIFMSLPKNVQWHYQDLSPEEDKEKALMEVIKTPKNWV